jgi:hypothetical protein
MCKTLAKHVHVLPTWQSPTRLIGEHMLATLLIDICLV